MIGVYYTAYLDDHFLWSTILLEHMKLMEDSGLLKKVDKITFVVITKEDDRVRMFHDLLLQYNVPVKINLVRNQYNNDIEMMQDLGRIFENVSKNPDERLTFKIMREDCENVDQNILYLHSKGVMSIVNNLMVPGRASKFKNRYYWRQFMNKAISSWEECNEKLIDNDVVGIDFQDNPSNHFRGNFFWTKSSHVLKLPPADTIEWYNQLKARVNNDWLNIVCDRFASEMWVCSLPETKYYNITSNNGDYVENDI